MASKKVSHRSKAQQQAAKESRHDLAAEVAIMAKRANQRLREIEKQGLQAPSHAYRYVERLASDGDRATGVDNKGRFKWNTNTRRQSYQDLQHEYAELDRFLNKAKTSTTKGTRAQFKKGYETYKKKHETDAEDFIGSDSKPLSESEYGDMWGMRNISNLRAYGSSQLIKLVEDAREKGLTLEEIDNVLDTVPPDATLLDLYDAIDEWRPAGPDEGPGT